jgi:maltose alpha-D-glucosyltransferase/alpha-amylase
VTRRVELLNSLLLSMPGTTLYYGDELGMGDNIYLGDRDGVRTPMQWSPTATAVFPRRPARLVLPPIMDPLYGYQTVNVETRPRPAFAAELDPAHAGGAQAAKAFGRGTLRMLTPSNRRILAYTREYTDATASTKSFCAWPTCRAARRRRSWIVTYVDMVRWRCSAVTRSRPSAS